jgi:acetylornithine deacetylase/succinyl-diaminopimelate desuccinylase-like protein
MKMPEPASILDRVLAHADASRTRYVADLFTLLRQPTISTQGIGMAEGADLLVRMMRSYGIPARLVPTPGAPVVYAELPGPPGSPVVLIYGHYDVQPPEPLEEWLSPPFEPVVRDGRIFARGAGDNKGQTWCHMAAIRSWLEVAGRVPLTIKLAIEGEEECGSKNLKGFLLQHRELLAADLVYWSDGWMHETGAPAVTLGARGNCYIELEARGANRDLHSGNIGGNVPNPAWDLVRLLATMVDGDGRVLVEGFYDHIQPPSPAERAALAKIPFDPQAVLADLELDAFWGRPDLTYHEKLMFWPTFTICGLGSGYTGPGSKTVLPHRAIAKLDMRLVMDMDPSDIFGKVAAHVRKHAPHIKVRQLGGTPPSKTPIDHPYTAVMVQAARLGFAVEPVVLPSSGGSSPDHLFTRELGMPIFCIPYANPDENNHAPNENIKLDCFFGGIRTSAALFSLLAAHAGKQGNEQGGKVS